MQTKILQFRPEAIDMASCNENMYDENDSIVHIDGKTALFHYHDQECSISLVPLVDDNFRYDRRIFFIGYRVYIELQYLP